MISIKLPKKENEEYRRQSRINRKIKEHEKEQDKALKDIENYIRDFIEVNPIEDFDYLEEAEFIQDKVPNKNKLQDSLLVLNKVHAPMDLVLLVKQRLKIYK